MNANGFTSILNLDEVLISAMEHHSNIVPWQMLCERTGAVLSHSYESRGELIMAEYDKLLSEKTKIVATIHISNALNPIKYIDQAHTYGAAFDRWSASCSPFKPNMQELDCDLCFFRT
jgi:cysteine desulfurase/selenocysteine lyase